jgi:hypothetical protein
MIDDTDNSFSTPPFQIRYARQDVFLSIMISFYLAYGECEVSFLLSFFSSQFLDNIISPLYVYMRGHNVRTDTKYVRKELVK